MKRYLAIFLIILTIPSLAYSEQKQLHNKKLVFSLDIIRHGYRSPIKYIPNMTESSWNTQAPGTLTPLGAKRSQEVGQNLKNHYIDKLGFIESNPPKESIYVASSEAERTISTANHTLKGMFGKHASNITVNVIPGTSDLLKSPKSREGMSNIIFDSLDKKKQQEFQDMMQYLNNRFNLKITTIEEVMAFGDLLSVNRIHKKSFPESELPKAEADKLVELREFLYVYRNKVRKFMCTASKNILLHAKNELEGKIENKMPHKVAFYFAHDSNIMSILSIFNKLPSRIPPYNSDLRFELYNNDAHYYVRVLLNDEVVPVCETEFCEFEQFSSLVDNNIQNKCK